MINQFDSDNYPDEEPRSVVVGSRWGWKRSDITSAYPTATYTLQYQFSLQSASPASFSITADKVSSEHVVEQTSVETGVFAPGEYYWQAEVVRDSDSESVTVATGVMTLTDDYGDSPGDVRSWVSEVLQAIRAVIAQSASKEQKGYTVFGRSLERRSLSELMELEREFNQRYQSELDKVDRENGRPVTSNRVYMKMEA